MIIRRRILFFNREIDGFGIRRNGKSMDVIIWNEDIPSLLIANEDDGYILHLFSLDPYNSFLVDGVDELYG